MSGVLAIGLVGCGRLAEVGYVPALRAAAGMRLAAVADPDPARRRHVAPSLPGFDSAAALLADHTVDALVLATPAATHADDAARAAAAGVPTLVEKPPADEVDGAAALAAVEPRPWVAFNRRFGDGQRAVRAAIPTAGELDLRLELHYRRGGWGALTVRDDALLDLGPHLVDLARWLTGSGVTAVRDATLSTERAAFTLALDRGLATIRCATDLPHRERVEVRDRRGVVLARHWEGGLAGALTGRLPRGRPHPLVASLTAQLEAFAVAVRGGPLGELGTAADGLAVMTTIAAIRACAASRRPTTVPTDR